MDIVSSRAEQYALAHTSAESDLMHNIASHTGSHHPHADMLSSHVQGKFLEMISCLMQPARILEIGTFVGYSGLYLSKGLREGGKLHTIELREQDAATARENFRKAGVQDSIVLHVGNALQIIPTLQEEWDLVFIDADKVGYADYYRLVLPRLRRGGLIIADNVLFHAEVLQEKIKGKNALAIHAFNQMVKDDAGVEKVMLTVRDGLFLIRKK